MKNVSLIWLSCLVAGCASTSAEREGIELSTNPSRTGNAAQPLYSVVSESETFSSENNEATKKFSSPALEDALKKMLARMKKENETGHRAKSRWVEGIYTIKKGDTLSQIVRDSTAGTNVKADFLLDTIVKLNPRAFVRGNPDWMLAGAKLRFPSSDDFQKIIFKDQNSKGSNETADPYEGWIKYP